MKLAQVNQVLYEWHQKIELANHECAVSDNLIYLSVFIWYRFQDGDDLLAKEKYVANWCAHFVRNDRGERFSSHNLLFFFSPFQTRKFFMHLVRVVCRIESDCWSSEEKLSFYFYRYELQFFWKYFCFFRSLWHLTLVGLWATTTVSHLDFVNVLLFGITLRCW